MQRSGDRAQIPPEEIANPAGRRRWVREQELTWRIRDEIDRSGVAELVPASSAVTNQYSIGAGRRADLLLVVDSDQRVVVEVELDADGSKESGVAQACRYRAILATTGVEWRASLIAENFLSRSELRRADEQHVECLRAVDDRSGLAFEHAGGPAGPLTTALRRAGRLARGG